MPPPLLARTPLDALEVALPADVTLHMRPAALIVRIVQRHGTPVEVEVEGDAFNAASILQLLVAVHAHPYARRLRFRGGARPLEDLRLLFESGLGEGGLDRLPPSLSYLRERETLRRPA
ncbi:MAG TPA: HPr family phosphocarrier protein [Planctomycetota bacterium]|jgi:phosphotransferase system HPr-like phosphotransfer protein|nr:HPr family phosphocarrier protein [Planctomycetota bacterium]